ncbi:unnamed protein product [Diabrotica balteata]|uniref:Uncharacterized protein n=1 Tax=Diabrotica balteata TaxID=107213 RepID=A0A9N9XFI1_DIABA|nr:unnamed protein product [Diabrotica balteata]
MTCIKEEQDSLKEYFNIEVKSELKECRFESNTMQEPLLDECYSDIKIENYVLEDVACEIKVGIKEELEQYNIEEKDSLKEYFNIEVKAELNDCQFESNNMQEPLLDECYSDIKIENYVLEDVAGEIKVGIKEELEQYNIVMEELKCGFCDQTCYFKESKTLLFGCACDNCEKVSCKECSKISSQEIRCAIAKTRTIIIWCKDCINQFSNIDSPIRNPRNAELTMPQLSNAIKEMVKCELSEGMKILEQNLQEKLVMTSKMVIDSNKELVKLLSDTSKLNQSSSESRVNVATPTSPPLITEDNGRSKSAGQAENANVASSSSSNSHLPKDQKTLVHSENLEKEENVTSGQSKHREKEEIVNKNKINFGNKHSGDNDQKFTLVQRRKARRNDQNFVLGKANFQGDENFASSFHKAYFYLGRVKMGITPTFIEQHVKKQCPNIRDFKVEPLPVKGENISFKISIHPDDKEDFSRPDIWPKGIILRKFWISNKRQSENFQQDRGDQTRI